MASTVDSCITGQDAVIPVFDYRMMNSSLGAGVFAGGMGTLVGHPFDSLKVRTQVGKTLERLRPDFETLRQLYRGVWGPVMLSGVAASLNFTMYEFFKSEVSKRQIHHHHHHNSSGPRRQLVTGNHSASSVFFGG